MIIIIYYNLKICSAPSDRSIFNFISLYFNKYIPYKSYNHFKFFTGVRTILHTPPLLRPSPQLLLTLWDRKHRCGAEQRGRKASQQWVTDAGGCILLPFGACEAAGGVSRMEGLNLLKKRSQMNMFLSFF